MSTHGGNGIGERVRQTRDEASAVGGEFKTILDDLRILARKEVELAQAEAQEQVGLATRAGIFGGIALVAAMAGVVFGFLTLMFVLCVWMPMWVAALVTTLVIFATAFIAAVMAREGLRRIRLMPERTISSIREDLVWARDRMT